MYDVWWFIHIVGIALWFGVTAASLLVWPYASHAQTTRMSTISTLVSLTNRAGHTGAGLTALGGVALSFSVPKSELASLWLMSMQGIGTFAFVISVIVLTRIGKRLAQPSAYQPSAEPSSLPTPDLAHRYVIWLWVVFACLMVSLVMAAFKPQ